MPDKYSNEYLQILTLVMSSKEHTKIVVQVLQIFKDNNLSLHIEKCSFHKKEIDYLGLVVGNGLIKMDPCKVAAVTDWPNPTSVSEVRRVLGFFNYYRRFICDFSHIARLLHDLTKWDIPFQWGDIHAQAFATLKQAITSQCHESRPFRSLGRTS